MSCTASKGNLQMADTEMHCLHTDMSRMARFAGPLYVQVADALRGRILDREWTSRNPMPSEIVLAGEMQVSVGTVRKALELLETESLIRRVKGRGTYVQEASEESENARFSHIHVDGRKSRHGQSSIEITEGTATPEECERLALAPGDQVYRIKRLMIEPQHVIIHERITVPAKLFPDLPTLDELSQRILFPLYRKHYDVIVSQARETVAAVMADPDLAALLRLKNQQCVLRIDRVATAIGLGPVEWLVQHANLVNASYEVTTQ